jgi:hypothetical protein
LETFGNEQLPPLPMIIVSYILGLLEQKTGSLELRNYSVPRKKILVQHFPFDYFWTSKF